MKKKFELKPFDKVLVRDGDEEEWRCGIYSHRDCCTNGYWAQCIAYEGNEHLLGTTDAYVEPFIPQKGDFITTPRGAILICSGNISRHSIYLRIGSIVHLSARAPYPLNIYTPENKSYKIDLDIKDGTRLSTDKEKKFLLSKLHEIGKDWDAERKEIVDWKCEPNTEGMGELFVKSNCEQKETTHEYREKQMLTTKEAAELLGVTVSYLYKLTHNKEIPHYKPQGKFCYFDRDELIQWMRRGRVQTNEEIEAAAQSYCMKKRIL